MQAGLFLELPCADSAELAGLVGWDYVVIDCEHAPITPALLPAMLRAASAGSVRALVRVPAGTPEAIQQALDCGAAGIVVPRIQSLEEAKAVVAAARFSPLGQRGVNGFVRANRYALGNLDEYLASSNTNVVVSLQVETRGALESVEALAALPGCSGLFVGPYDLSQSLGLAGQVLHPEVLAAGRRTLAAAQAHGKQASVFVNSPEAAQAWLDLGYTDLAYSADIFLLGQAFRQALATVKGLMAPKQP